MGVGVGHHGWALHEEKGVVLCVFCGVWLVVRGTYGVIRHGAGRGPAAFFAFCQRRTAEMASFGNTDVLLPRIGFGAMGITSFYAGEGPSESIEEQGIQAMVAYAQAVAPLKAHIDTALVYTALRPGGRHNEEVVGEAVRRIGRDNVFLATKGSMTMAFEPDSSDAGLRSQLASSLTRLGVSSVDLFYEHRRDPGTPIESVMATMKALAGEGKIKFAGLSEVTATELRRACAVFPVTAVQMEYSLQARSIESELLGVAKELGVAVVAYSPLGRGMLASTFKCLDALPEGDWRRASPRWGEQVNFAKAAALPDLAASCSITPAQLALAWVLSRGDHVFAIPGTKSPARALENSAASALKLSAGILAKVEAAVPEAEGDRYANKHGQFETRA